MARRNGFRINFLVALTIVVVSVLGSIAWLVNRYPWPVYLSDFSLAKESAFVAHWPLPSMEEDRQERKKLKRFPRTEQQRRLGVVMRRMDYLNVPLYDFFLDSGIQYISPEIPAGVSSSSPLIWPSMSTRRKMGTEDTSFKDVRYVVIPSSSGAQCMEGVAMTAGEELRINLPVARNKRNIILTILPLAPSNLRASMGQYSWARIFTDADVNRLHSISVPINDPAAALLRLSLGSGNLLLNSASIAQWDRSGRLPVQMGLQSSIWKSANEKTSESQESAATAQEQTGEDAAGNPVNPEDAQAQAANAASQPAAGANPVDVNQPSANTNTSANANATPAATGATTVSQASTSQPSAANASKADPTKGKDGKAKVSVVDDLLDPVSVKYNPIVPVSGSKTVAIGYNVALFQMDALVNLALADETMFAALAPNLHKFLSQSLALQVKLPQFNAATELFQHSVIRQAGEFIPVDLPILTKDLVSGNSVFNLYQEFRNFGYRVVSFAPPAALSFPEILSAGPEIPKVDGRWLDSNDWKFVARRRELDQQNEPASGLEAIFKSERGVNVASVNEGDFQKMAELLEGLERQSDSIPDWKANEIAVVSSKGHYLPRLVDSFQRWSRENAQVRFFAHVFLQNNDSGYRPSFKDFLQVLKYKKLKALALPGTTEKYARIVMMDRVFGLLVDSLVARRTYHRTVISVLIPGAGKDKASGEMMGRFVVGVPGLAARKVSLSKEHSLDDALATMAQSVGVQFNKLDSNGRVIFKGEGLDEEKTPAVVKTTPSETTEIAAGGTASTSKNSPGSGATSGPKGAQATGAIQAAQSAIPDAGDGASLQQTKPKHVSRFRMIVLPRAAGCQSFEWVTSAPYFGLTSTQPIIEEPSPRGRVIRVYPCGLRDQVIELSWFQNHEGPLGSEVSSATVSSWLGGTLQLKGENTASENSEAQDPPFFLVGPQALSLDSLPLRLETFLPTEIPHLFDIETRKGVERETLARILNLNTQIQSSQMSARTLVYFFREPVRR